MATGRAYSGKEFDVRIGIQDISETNLGTQPATDGHMLTPVTYRLNGLNDIAWDGGYQRAEIDRSGTRIKQHGDIINHYGSGIWTWDFDWTVDNEVGIQNLLNLIYPDNANGAESASGFIIPAVPAVNGMKHGQATGRNSVACIIIKNPNDDEDRFMHSAVLQNLTLSMDVGTDGGLMKASGQFMSGYKPGLGDYDTMMASPSATSIFRKGLFDFTAHTFGPDDMSVKAFSLTITNPATRVGFQGSAGETDGYSRGANMEITGDITMKADDNAMENLDLWQANTNVAIELDDGSNWDFSLPECNMSGHAMDMADEGIFVNIPFTVTSGTSGGAVPVTIKVT
jgi:hypothetical protein